MTNKEVQSKIRIVKSKEWFENVEASFTFDHLKIDIEKKSFFDIYQYVARQNRGFEKIDIPLPRELNLSKDTFASLNVKLETFLNSGLEYEEVTLNSNWTEIFNQINTLNSINYFPIDSPITTFLLDTFKISDSHYTGAYRYLCSPSNLSFSNYEEFAGAIMAYEYRFEDGSKLPKRRSHEKTSNNRIRNSFEKLFTETQKEVNKFFNDYEVKSKEQTETLASLLLEKQTIYEQWFDESKKNEELYNKHNLQRVKDLENLYSEKLMLEKPADYWNKRAIKLRKEANKWLKGLILCTSLAVLVLILILAFISNGTLLDLFSKTGSAIRWSIVLITLISFLAFAVRTFTKLSFSAYHLVRDAEERKQLVYVYLALKQEKAVEENERILILQSIFSRADTGLLKEDSSPAMPGSSGIIDKLMKN
jgi:cytochrome c oxidase subunit IV